MIFILYPPSGFVTPALVQIGNQSFKMMYYLWVLPSQAFNAVIIVIIEDVKQGKGQDCLQMAFGCSLSCLNSEPPSTFYSSIPSSQWEYLHPLLTYLYSSGFLLISSGTFWAPHAGQMISSYHQNVECLGPGSLTVPPLVRVLFFLYWKGEKQGNT